MVYGTIWVEFVGNMYYIFEKYKLTNIVKQKSEKYILYFFRYIKLKRANGTVCHETSRCGYHVGWWFELVTKVASVQLFMFCILWGSAYFKDFQFDLILWNGILPMHTLHDLKICLLDNPI
jgi:hypothetical protein